MDVSRARAAFNGTMRSDVIEANPEPEAPKQELDPLRKDLAREAAKRCSRCLQFGHATRDCTSKGAPAVGDRCFKCGGTGHLARSCSHKGSLNTFGPRTTDMHRRVEKNQSKAKTDAAKRSGGRRGDRGAAKNTDGGRKGAEKSGKRHSKTERRAPAPSLDQLDKEMDAYLTKHAAES